jgi:phenylacetate-CoA ligase
MGLKALNRLNAGFLGLPAGGLNPGPLSQARANALRLTLEWARENSPFYCRRLAGLDLDQFMGPGGLAGLPFTTALDLAKRPQDLLCLSQSRVERVITLHSSGSSGAAKRLFFTKQELEDTAAFFRAGFDDLLGPDGMVLALLPHNTPDGAGHLLARALEDGGRVCRVVWPVDDMREAARLTRDHRPACLVGLPVHLLNLAERLGPGVAGAALFCSEYVPTSLRRRVEDALEAPSYIHYGSSESGLGGAVECGPGCGCHARADILWEVVEPGGNISCRDGEPGELVITTLRRRAMPLIRYRTGDLVRLSHDPCPCGGLGPRLTWLGGRMQGPRLEHGGILRQEELDEALFAIPGLMDFRVYLEWDAGDVLHTEYVTEGVGSGLGTKICRALAGVPQLARALAGGSLSLDRPEPVAALAASHTIKRIVMDQRGQGAHS